MNIGVMKQGNFSTEMRLSHFQKGNGLSASVGDTSES